jgi:hypothetical protein
MMLLPLKTLGSLHDNRILPFHASFFLLLLFILPLLLGFRK